MENEMLTVKEWAEKSGLKLYNYDGFLDIYNQLSPKDGSSFVDYTTIRFKAAGDLVCSRESFETHLSNCTMNIPRTEELEKISEVLPYFVEQFVNLRLGSTVGFSRHNMIKPEDVEKELKGVLDLLAQKLSARAKSIALNPSETSSISSIKDDELKTKVTKMFHSKADTVEKAELLLSQNIAKEIERIFRKHNIKMTKTLIDELSLLTDLFYESARVKREFEQSNHFMLVTTDKVKQDDVVVPYHMIDGEGMHPGVVFDVNTDEAHISGAVPISEETKEQLDEEINSKQL